MNLAQSMEAFYFSMEILAAILLYLMFLERRPRFWRRVFGCMGILFVCALLIHPILSRIKGSWFLLSFLLLLFLCKTSCSISWADTLFCMACGYATQHFASSLHMLVIYKGALPEKWSFYTQPSYLIIYIAVYLLFYLLFARNLAEQGHYNTSKELALTMISLVLTVAIIMNGTAKDARFLSSESNEKSNTILFVICQVYALFVCFLMLWIQLLQRKQLHVQKKLEQNAAMWKQRELQYRLSRENIDLINRKCHDLRHQIEAISHMKNENGQKQSFLKEIRDMVEVYDSSVDAGNEALNTILMEKSLYCKFHDIHWSCMADGKILDFMDMIDLYTLLGNGLDNAIESVEKISDDARRMISVRIWKKNGFAVLQIENCYDGILEIENGLPITKKEDKVNHGLGLKSMRAITEKYQGTFSIRTENGRFLVYVLIPIESAEWVSKTT